MSKLSFMKWYPADWINDTRELSSEAKGCWIDMLCLMWNAPQRGVWKGTYLEFARATGIPGENALKVVQELSRSASRVTFRNKIVTLENRRMVNQEKHYKSNAIRQARYRSRRSSNEKVTDKTLDSSIVLKITKTTPTHRAQAPKPIFSRPLAHEVTAYANTLGFKLDGSAFCDYYESKGWKIGNSPMRNWQAAVRTWHKKQLGENYNGADGSTSVSGETALERRVREVQGLRKVDTAATAFAGLRDIALHGSTAGKPDGSRG